MRLGLLPSQQRALDKAFKKARLFDNFRRRTRRQLLAAGAFGILATITGFWAGRYSATTESNESATDRHAWVRSIANSPIATLRPQAMHLFEALTSVTGDDPLWGAYHRLVAYALQHPEDETLRRQLKKASAHEWAPQHAKEAASSLPSAPR
jgi:hypothetical protein